MHAQDEAKEKKQRENDNIIIRRTSEKQKIST